MRSRNIDEKKLVLGDKKKPIKMPPVATTKLPGRQTNNSLSSVTGTIVIQTTTAQSSTVSTTTRRKKTKQDT